MSSRPIAAAAAAAAAKSLQSCPTLSDPMDCRPPGSSVHGIFQAHYSMANRKGKVETVTDFNLFHFLGSKITEDGDCSHEIKRCHSLERKL